MLSKEDNELLTRVGPGTPMGEMLREYWMPAVRSQLLEADGKPERVRLLGENFVAFRATDGRVGFIDEACPHRCASMALGRNEENGLRCIFHGWKVNVEGRVIDCPTEPEERRERFASLVPTRRHHVHETGGVVWVYIGNRAEPPAFPNLEFTDLPADHCQPMRGVIKCNWLQALEAALDSAHVGFLHARGSGPERGTEAHRTESNFMRVKKDPKFEYETTATGFTEAAIRALPDGNNYTRIRHVVMPFFSLIPRFPGDRALAVCSVPIDDETTAQWYLRYQLEKPIDINFNKKFGTDSGDPNYFNSDMGDITNMWNQDREAMKTHWSGIVGRQNAYEDFVVQESMGRIVDRSKEYLGAADVVISLARRLLLQAVRSHAADGTIPFTSPDADYARLRSLSVTYPQTQSWKEIDPFNPPEMGWTQPVG
ncbi:MAG: Rieske 2Fe-2S domain-containing protein [Sphingomonas sp.]